MLVFALIYTLLIGIHVLMVVVILTIPQPGFQPPLGLANEGFATAAGGPVHHVGLLLHQLTIHWSTLSGGNGWA